MTSKEEHRGNEMGDIMNVFQAKDQGVTTTSNFKLSKQSLIAANKAREEL